MGEHSVYITVQICFDLLAGIQVGIRQHGGDGFPGRKRQQLARGGCGILTFCGQQSAPGLQIQVSVLLYHRSAPASSGRTSFSASMPDLQHGIIRFVGREILEPHAGGGQDPRQPVVMAADRRLNS